MSKKIKFIAGIATVAAFSAVAYYFSKMKLQLNVTDFEESVLSKYPGAKITSIEKTYANDNLYTVTIILQGEEHKLYVTADGEVIETASKVHH